MIRKAREHGKWWASEKPPLFTSWLDNLKEYEDWRESDRFAEDFLHQNESFRMGGNKCFRIFILHCLSRVRETREYREMRELRFDSPNFRHCLYRFQESMRNDEFKIALEKRKGEKKEEQKRAISPHIGEVQYDHRNPWKDRENPGSRAHCQYFHRIIYSSIPLNIRNSCFPGPKKNGEVPKSPALRTEFSVMLHVLWRNDQRSNEKVQCLRERLSLRSHHRFYESWWHVDLWVVLLCNQRLKNVHPSLFATKLQVISRGKRFNTINLAIGTLFRSSQGGSKFRTIVALYFIRNLRVFSAKRP